MDCLSGHFISDVDDLPVAVENSLGGHTQLEIGYKVGVMNEDEAYLNNHLKFSVKYHEVQ